MVNPMLLIAGIGMMLVGIIAVIYWKRKTQVAISYFFFGAVVWIIAIMAKIAMDLTITKPIQIMILGNYGITATIAVMGLYVGLRTGLFESGFTYIAVLKTKLKNMGFNEAIAFGIGFGAIEAFILGALSFISVMVLMLYPELLSALSAADLQLLNMPGWIVIFPIIERMATLLIHIFASVLVIYSIRVNKMSFLFISVLYKTLLDGMIPFMKYYMSSTEFGIFVMEIPIVILALIGFFGTRWVGEKFIAKDKTIKTMAKPRAGIAKPVKRIRRAKGKATAAKRRQKPVRKRKPVKRLRRKNR